MAAFFHKKAGQETGRVMGISTAYRVLGVLWGGCGQGAPSFSTGSLRRESAHLIVVAQLCGGFCMHRLRFSMHVLHN